LHGGCRVGTAKRRGSVCWSVDLCDREVSSILGFAVPPRQHQARF
jgi:hypothetical protein